MEKENAGQCRIQLPAGSVQRAVGDLCARLYAGEVLGIVEKAHQDLFDGIHVRRDVRNLEDISKIFAKYGKTEQQFLDATKSFAVEMKLNRAKQMVPRFQIDGTPQRDRCRQVPHYRRFGGWPGQGVRGGRFLIAKEIAAKKAAAPAAAARQGLKRLHWHEAAGRSSAPRSFSGLRNRGAAA